MALATQLSVSSIPNLYPPIVSKNSRSLRSQCSAFPRKDVAEKLYHIGTVRTFSKKLRKRRESVLHASSENEIVSNEETPVADAVSAGAKEENSSGPPVLTIIAGLLVGVGFLWAAGSILRWFISLFFR